MAWLKRPVLARCALLAALFVSPMLVSAVKPGHRSFPTLEFSSGRAVLVVELLGEKESAAAEVLEWDNFARSIGNPEHVGVRILRRGKAAGEHAAMMQHATPFHIPDSMSSWSQVLGKLQSDEPTATLVGLFAAGTRPRQDLEHSIIALLDALSDSSEHAMMVVSRSRIRGQAIGVPGGYSTWLSDTLVSQLWCNIPALTAAQSSEALGRIDVQEVGMLGVISILLEAARTGTRDGGDSAQVRLVDGTDTLRSVVYNKAPSLWCHNDTLAHYSCESPRAVLQHDADAKTDRQEELYSIGNVGFSIGSLGDAIVPEVQDDGSPLRHSVGRAAWPQKYLLESVASKDGFIIVTSVNCGYLDMAVNFLRSVQEHSLAKVRSGEAGGLG